MKSNDKIFIFLHILYSVLIISFGFFLVRNHEISFECVKNSSKICCETLIPSLFPFMFFSSLVINSKASYLVNKLFAPIAQFLSLPKEAISVIIMSMIGGFPVGAKGIKDLHDRRVLTREQSERMLMFCVNSGPSFVLGVVGSSLMKNMKVAAIILISQIISSIIIALILNTHSRKNNILLNRKKNDNETPSFIESLINSCEASCLSMMNLCSLVVIFNVLFAFLDYFNIKNFLKSLMLSCRISNEFSNCILPTLIEVTNACISVSQNGNNPILFSLATSWAGICVHMQVFSIMKGIEIRYSKFAFFRIINSMISCFFTYMFLKFKPLILNSKFEISRSSHLIGSVVLILFCIYFIIDINLSRKSKI